MLKRRQLFQFAGVAAVAAAGGAAWMYYGSPRSEALAGGPFRHYPFDPVAADNFQQKLFIPVGSGPFGVLDVAGPLKIRATAASFPLLPGRESPFLLYQTEQAGKAYQNPILRIESGARFTASLDNALQEPTIIHWHGLHTPAAMDGHPASTIGPGGRYAYDFKVNNRGGTYWYHTHAHELTAEQAYHGLASFFLVDDDDQRRVSKALDLQLGVTDLPLVIQDKQFDAQGKLLYKPGAHEAMMGWLGDIMLANLTPNAVQAVTPRTYRLRLLNGSNARIYRLAFVKGNKALDFTVIGTDGGLIERPETVSEAFLAPGERLDVLFDAGQARPGEDIFLRSLTFDAMENEGPAAGPGGMPGMSGMGMGQMMASMSSSRLPLGLEFNILKLSVTAGERVVAKLPATLSQVKPIPTEGATQRKIELSMGQMRFLINGYTFRMDEIAFDVKRGAVEIWSISNPALGMPHPMHIHGFSFQVLERIGSPPQIAAMARFGQGRTVSDLGWKDTVLVWPGETVRVAIDFAHDYPGDQTYVFHCHNLEHEDGGMMINFRVKA
ncbi:MAG: multicopper oxidase domain-containing protein [Burkholderiaceae bacterium]|jgi:blue copper oxidase|uniref:multicopper oxidase family protein n=1 Tax=unclassified Polaromonas TaxID=2638319 RepID=UPI000BD25492|nr:MULTISPECIES: multicopper oxidase domain-containing protein [unclassified Polaromonas]MDO8772926.1 multicopper oxidase domain-containing protein [Burkholderiaceae bacterium]OYY33508.1 MAG: Bilirubin oxidase [Polaromonas sp. 35-63-35]OYZ17717.1 MAG: Bilirubin oxidase [Polaromonas sp. 16-63-31]OYZ76919.1 MAG: Bilirubin oxidase [Polaromonas sp. 24-63-21]OZA47962.1 MAG: Bilirubin oxidase [Polaromonas sp. 17-63-33]